MQINPNEDILQSMLKNINIEELKNKGAILMDDFVDLKIRDFPEKIIAENCSKENLNQFLKFDRLQYEAVLKGTNQAYNYALERMKVFKQEDILTLHGDAKLNYLMKLKIIYAGTCFYPDKEIHAFFKQVGFNEDNLSWMIGLESILQEFENIINSEKVVFLEGLALMSIQTYLRNKIHNEIMYWGDEYQDRYEGNKYANMTFVKAKEQIAVTGELEIPDEYKEQISFLDRLLGKEKNQNNILNSFKGDSLKVQFNFITDICIKFTKIKSETQFYAEFFELIRLLNGPLKVYSKSYDLLSEKEFYKIYTEGASFEIYKGKRIRSILTRGK